MNKNVTIHLNVHSSMATLCLPLGYPFFFKGKIQNLEFQTEIGTDCRNPPGPGSRSGHLYFKGRSEETPGDSLIFSYTPQVLLWGVCAVYFSCFCVWESSVGLVNIQAAWFQHQ